MKLFKIRGGVHPDDRKSFSSEKAIERLPMPELLYVPLQQHIGAPAECVVEIGDKVKKGQLIGEPKGFISAPVHAPTSGDVVAIHEHAAPHASGLAGLSVTIATDGEDEWGETLPPMDPNTAEPGDIAKRVAECGVVGMGGATFPSAVKLNLRDRYDLKTLVINGAECEPYLTCDDRIMRERTKEVLEGVNIMRRALGAPEAIVAIEKNKPQAIEAMTRESAAFEEIKVVGVPTRYPMGSEKHLVQTLTGKETPARGLTADIGVVVHNAATAYAVRDAVLFGRPLVQRVVTVSGSAMKNTANLEVLIGTPVNDLAEYCGGYTEDPGRTLLGGPMMGTPLGNLHPPVVKGTNGFLALTKDENEYKQPMPCIRCASCVDACPCGLLPLEMAARIRKEELDGAVKIGLSDCISCGSCSYVCPSNIPLVQFFNYAKGKMTANKRDADKNEETKVLAQRRQIRIEKEKAKKKEAMARRKAEQAAKRKAAAEKKAAEEAGDAKPDDAKAEKPARKREPKAKKAAEDGGDAKAEEAKSNEKPAPEKEPEAAKAAEDDKKEEAAEAKE